MSVTLTIKQVPDQIAEHLRALAAKNHRSLQGELMSIIERAALTQEVGKPDSRGSGAANDSTQREDPSAAQPGMDGLIDELDAIVAGSEWGTAPLLTRAQANDRALGKELHYLATENQTK